MLHERPMRGLSHFEWLSVQHAPCRVKYRRVKLVREDAEPASAVEQVQELTHSPIEIIRLKVHLLPLPGEDARP